MKKIFSLFALFLISMLINTVSVKASAQAVCNGSPCATDGSPASVTDHPAVFLNDITISQAALLSLQPSGVQTFSVATNCLVGDRLIMVPGTASIPAGYMLGDISCPSNGAVSVKLFTPALGLGVSYSFTVKVIAFR